MKNALDRPVIDLYDLLILNKLDDKRGIILMCLGVTVLFNNKAVTLISTASLEDHYNFNSLKGHLEKLVGLTDPLDPLVWVKQANIKSICYLLHSKGRCTYEREFKQS